MPNAGVIRNRAGFQFLTNWTDSNYVALLPPSTAPASIINVRWFNTLPASTEAVTVSPTGQLGTTPVSGGGGTVTSVAVTLPSIFSVTGSPITTNGTISATLASQTQNFVFAAPGTGGNGSPVFRALIAADIPNLTAVKITDFDTQVRISRLDQMAAPTTTVNFNSQRAIGLADPVNAQDAATKNYVDALANGETNKGTARVATTAALSLTSATATTITISGGMPTTLDGVTLATNDIILVKDQTGGTATGAAANGLYVYTAGTTWTRATNADTSAEVRAGMFVFVSEGTANGDNGYTLTTNDPITLGTTQLTFTQTSGAGQIVAGAGLTKTGNTIDVGGTANRILVNADTIDIAATYVGQASITTLGTITTGTWNGTSIAVANGGTGATTAAAARTNLSAAGIFRASFTNASLSGGQLTVTHNLDQQIVVLQVYDNSNQYIIADNVTLTSSTVATVDLTSFGTITGTWNVVVTG